MSDNYSTGDNYKVRDLDQARMLDAVDGAPLLEEPLHGVGLPHRLGFEQLDGHATPQLEVARLEYRSCAALA